MDDWFLQGLRDANRAMRATPTPQQKRRIWQRILKRIRSWNG